MGDFPLYAMNITFLNKKKAVLTYSSADYSEAGKIN